MRGVGLPSTTRGGEGIGWPIGDDDFVVGLFRGNEREVDAGRLECGVRDVEGRLELRRLGSDDRANAACCGSCERSVA